MALRNSHLHHILCSLFKTYWIESFDMTDPPLKTNSLSLPGYKCTFKNQYQNVHLNILNLVLRWIFPSVHQFAKQSLSHLALWNQHSLKYTLLQLCYHVASDSIFHLVHPRNSNGAPPLFHSQFHKWMLLWVDMLGWWAEIRALLTPCLHCDWDLAPPCRATQPNYC